MLIEPFIEASDIFQRFDALAMGSRSSILQGRCQQRQATRLARQRLAD